jgi:hypothetical protein
VTEVGKRQLLQHDERAEWQQCRQRLVRVPELDLERRAALAGAKVAADQGPGTAPQPLGHLAELESYLLT